MGAILTGAGLGFLVALQPGPMSLFLVRSTLREGWRAGLAIGAGIATIDGLYAAAGAAGAAPLVEITSIRDVLGVLGALVLIALGLRTLTSALRVRLGHEAAIEVSTSRRAFLTALGGTASNPSTILSWAAIFAAAETAGAGRGSAAAMLLVGGVALGSLAWVSALTFGVTLARRNLGARALRLADCLAGAGMLGFGAALGYSALHEH